MLKTLASRARLYKAHTGSGDRFGRSHVMFCRVAQCRVDCIQLMKSLLVASARQASKLANDCFRKQRKSLLLCNWTGTECSQPRALSQSCAVINTAGCSTATANILWKKSARNIACGEVRCWQTLTDDAFNSTRTLCVRVSLNL